MNNQWKITVLMQCMRKVKSMVNKQYINEYYTKLIATKAKGDVVSAVLVSTGSTYFIYIVLCVS